MHPLEHTSKAPACPDPICEAMHRAEERRIEAAKTRREACCGIRYEHGAFTQSQPCHDCPEVRR